MQLSPRVMTQRSGYRRSEVATPVLVPELHGPSRVRPVNAVRGGADPRLNRFECRFGRRPELPVGVERFAVAHVHRVLQRPDALAAVPPLELAIHGAIAEGR